MASQGRPQPGNWRATRRAVLAAWHATCHVCGHDQADQVDHVLNLARGGTDNPDNLRPIHGTAYGTNPCPTCGRRCHQDKTKKEQRIGMQRNAVRRPDEPHPGARPAPQPRATLANLYCGSN